MRLAAAVRRNAPPATRSLFSFFRRPTELDRLKANLDVSLQSGSKEPAIQSHLALAAAYIRLQQPSAALSHASSSSQLLSELPAPPISLVHDTAKMLMELHAAGGNMQTALQHATECERTARILYKATDFELARTLYGVSYIQAGCGLMENAEKLCSEVVQILRLHKDKAFLGDALKALSGLQGSSGKMTEAMKSITESVQIFEDITDLDQLPSALLTLSDLYFSANKPHLVQSTCTKALSVLRNTSPKHPDLLSLCLDRLIKVALNRNDFATAQSFAQEKLDLDRKIQPENTLQAGLNHYTMGLIAFNKEDMTTARDQLEAAVPLLPEDSTGGMKTLTLLCKVHMSLNDPETAEKHADRLMSSVQRVENYPDLAGVYLDYGLVKEHRDKEEDALQAYRRCVELEEGKHTECSAFAYMNIGQIWAKRNEFRTAEDNYVKGCEIYREITHGDGPEMPVLWHNLATIQTSAERLEAAAENYKKSEQGKLKFCEEKSEMVLETRLCLAGVLMRLKRFAEAETLLRRCVAIHDGEHRKSASSLLVLALDQQGRTSEAEELAREHDKQS